MLTIHHLADSQSERIVWLAEELRLNYQLTRYERRTDNRLAPDAYKALHPMGVAPVIVDGDLVLGESGAICDYLTRRYAGESLSPSPEHRDYAEHLFWFHWSNATFMASLAAQLAVKVATGEASHASSVSDRVAICWNMIEERLRVSPYFGGERLTTADIMLVYCLTTARSIRGTSIQDRPNLLAYLGRIGERSAYRRAMSRAEPGREPHLT